MAKKKADGSPPQSRLERTAVVSGVVTAAAAKTIKSEVQALFLSGADKQALRGQTREEVAQIVFAGLTKLRGTALKLAQVFCADTGLLPDEYLRTFEQAHYRVPPLSAGLARSVLRRELKADPQSHFAEFDWHASRAASLGQVHRAKLLDGRDVAVKIQYPGMQESLISDMNLARLALKPLLRTGLIESTLAQLEVRLQQEVDYRRERANLEWFRSQAIPLALQIPASFEQASTSRVLTMEWIEGLTLDQWLETGPAPEEVNQKAQILFDLFVHSVFQLHRFHSDPNLGNFLVTDQPGIALLDFGAVTAIPTEDVAFYGQLWSRSTDPDSLLEEYARRGAAVDQTFWAEAVAPYTSWIGRFQSAESFDFAKNPDFVKQGFQLFTSQLFNPKLQNYSDQLTLVHRTLLGLFAIFTRLGATVNLAYKPVDSNTFSRGKS
jgi:predicted unusual protein kinase regulating ubiquinone biosynthesis (AarF/ABC1/UbiB family)